MIIAIIIGLVARYYDFRWVAMNSNFIKTLELACIIIMIFPMMVMMNFHGLGKAFSGWNSSSSCF
jgi:hypothetical protein